MSTWVEVEAYIKAMARYEKARQKARAILILVHECEPPEWEVDDLAGELIEGGKA